MAILQALPGYPRSVLLTAFFTISLGSRFFWACLSPALYSHYSSPDWASADGQPTQLVAVMTCSQCFFWRAWECARCRASQISPDYSDYSSASLSSSAFLG